jgi:hypothetical protein
VLAAAYAAYRFLFGREWLATSACFLIWFLLASLYKPRPNRTPRPLRPLPVQPCRFLAVVHRRLIEVFPTFPAIGILFRRDIDARVASGNIHGALVNVEPLPAFFT